MNNIVYITDDNYIMPTAVSITSLISNTEKAISITVICSNPCENINCLRLLESEKSRIRIVDVKDRYDFASMRIDCTKSGHVTQAALLKFFIPEIIKDIDVVLFIDGDTIISRDINELFDINLENDYIAAVRDIASLVSYDSYLERIKDINTIDNITFNSGVMLMDLKKMRNESVASKLIDKRKKYDDPLMDQCTLNHVLCGRWKELPLRYNFLTNLILKSDFDEFQSCYGIQERTYSDILNDQSILHFAGMEKPWNFYVPYISELFEKYYYRSPYKDSKLEVPSLMAKWNKEHSELVELYHQLYKRTNWLRMPKNIIKNIFGKIELK